MLRCVKGIQSDRLIIWHAENVTKKFQLPVSDTFYKRLGVGHGIDSGVGDMICFDVQHYAITGVSKSIYFVLHISADNPGLATVEQNYSDTS